MRQGVKTLRWKLKRGIETFVLRQNSSKKIKNCKGDAVRRRKGGRKRVREGKKRWRRCKMWRCNTDAFTHRHLLHTDTFYTQKLLHTDVFTPTLLHAHGFLYMEIFYTQTHLHTDAFTQIRFYTHTPFFTQRRFTHKRYTHRRIYTQTPLHTERHLPHLKNTFAAQPFCVDFTANLLWKRPPPHHHTTCGVQPFLHITLQICKEIVFPHGGFLHRRLYIQTLSHTEAFTRRHFYTHTSLCTQTLLHIDAFNTLPLLATIWRTDALTQQSLHREGTKIQEHTTKHTTKPHSMSPRGHKNRCFTTIFVARTFLVQNLLQNLKFGAKAEKKYDSETV